jgi:hypothetical protein
MSAIKLYTQLDIPGGESKVAVYYLMERGFEEMGDWPEKNAARWEEYEDQPHGWWPVVPGKENPAYGPIVLVRKLVW